LVKINRLLDELVIEEEIEASNRGCKLKLKTGKSLMVIGDPELLHSCFENILRNAIRYGPDNSTVTITAEGEAANNGKQIIVEISDEGPGVADEHLERIFEPYFRTASGNHDKDSTGLGLAIVKRIVERHSGDICALNKNAGGLMVRVSLPAADLN
jgi:two-component system OmpR family sensor kinase